MCELITRQDRDLEGSKDEVFISQEVFYGNVPALHNEHSVHGIDNLEKEQRKTVQGYFCSDLGNLSSRSLAAQKELAINDAGDGSYLYQKTSQSPRFTEKIIPVEMNNHPMPDKRSNLSIDELLHFKPYLEKSLALSVPMKNIVSGMHRSASRSNCQIFMCHVVESFGDGVTSSCYLLKKEIEKDRESNSRARDAARFGLSTSVSVERKELCVSKTIGSSVSQESIAIKDLVISPATMASNEPGSPTFTRRKIKRGIPVQLDDEDVLCKSDGAPDSRLLLRNQIFHLLIDAGWSIEKRKRESRNHAEFLYISPQVKPFRELKKAWIFFGKNILCQGNIQLQAEYDMEWSDIGQFWSDFSSTFENIDKRLKGREPDNALAYRWSLLDPFVSVVFVERKLRVLKSGNVVKANSSLVVTDNKSILGFRWANGNAGRHAPEMLSNCSFGLESSVIGFGGQPYAEAMEGPTTKSIYVSEGDKMLLVKAVSNVGSHYDVCMDEFTGMYPSSFVHNGSDIACHPSAVGLYDVPINEENVGLKNGGDTFSAHKYSCICPTGSNEHKLEMGNSGRVKPCRRRGGQRERRVGSLNNHLNAVDAEMQPLQSFEPHKFWHESETISSKDVMLRMVKPCRELGVNSERLMKNDAYSVANTSSKKKMCKRYKRMPKIEGHSSQHENSDMSPSYRVGTHIHKKIYHKSQLTSASFQGCPTDDALNSDSCKDISAASFQHQTGMTESECQRLLTCCSHDIDRLDKTDRDDRTDNVPIRVCVGPSAAKSAIKSTSKGRSIASKLKDDDMLVSAIIQTKSFSSGARRSKAKAGTIKSRSVKKRKTAKGRCGLLPRSIVRGCKHFADGRWTSMVDRTVLSWLINSGVISINDIIQYRNVEGDVVVKSGAITRDGIICKCCGQVLSLSKFKTHAGFEMNHPCSNLFMKSGKSFTLPQLQAWSAEYNARKSIIQVVQTEEFDQNDDSCGFCGEGGELLCCDNCPSTFHLSCLQKKELPEGNWYCSNCTCWVCENLAGDEIGGSLKCAQCNRKYHETCLRGDGISGLGSTPWLCSRGCEQVYSGLHSRVGILITMSDEFSWTLLRCIHDDQKVQSAQSLALKAECNSKLAVAITIMEECFLSMVDPRTGIDMIPHVLYNWGSTFARLNYQGFFTAVLEKEDVLISVASVRVHGTALAEMPLIATCSKYRRQGMCKRLLSAIEKMLISIRVEKLVIAALPDLVETWTVGFGFITMEEDEKKSLNKINLMVFPGTVMLKKTLFVDRASDLSKV